MAANNNKRPHGHKGAYDLWLLKQMGRRTAGREAAIGALEDAPARSLDRSDLAILLLGLAAAVLVLVLLAR